MYILAGEGFTDVFAQTDADHYEAVAKIPTAPGARTGLYAAPLHRLFLAVPHRGGQAAAIRVYEVRPGS